MNGLYKFDLKKGKLEVYSAGPRAFTQEPIFVPRTPEAPEGDGYLLALVNDYEEMVGKLVIIDTNRMSEPMATVRLPLPLRPGVHGAWVDDTDVDMRPVIPPVQQE
jgi:carotenoid cleavage dioxygenase-like enzyme